MDSVQLRNYELRHLIAEAKSENNINSLDSLKVKLDLTEKYTAERFPQLGLFNKESFKVSQLQKILIKGQLVVKYITLDNQLAVFTITRNEVNVILKPWSEMDFNTIEEFIKKSTNKEYNTILAGEIASNILPEIDENINHIIISPDKDLSKLPFEILNYKGSILIEKLNISYTSYLGFIIPEFTSVDHEEELAVYAPEYPQSEVQLAVRSKPAFLAGAQKESELISQLFPSRLFKGKNLTKQDFINTASKYKLLHLAMHAKIDDRQSGISRLLFSDENSETDDLYLEELYGLNLSADWAVLSACNTAVDNSDATTNIESFQRAFTFAGIPATIASLWEVPDKSTKEIMVNFYENLKKGQDKSQALKNAKITFKNKNKGSKLEQPYYWAGFVLYGNDQSVETPNNNILITILFGILFILFLVILRTRRNKI